MIVATPERIELQLEDLDDIVDRAGAALGKDDQQKLRTLLDAYVTLTDIIQDDKTTLKNLRALFRTSEKTDKVIGPGSKDQAGRESPPSESSSGGAENDEKKPGEKPKKPGHGRNGASAYTGAKKVPIAHPDLKAGSRCPTCDKGKVRAQRPSVIVKLTGGPPIGATAYECERFRCDTCGEVFTAPLPDGVNSQKYDGRAAAMIALLKYGSGLPFNRLERLQGNLGVPLPASTQWEVIEDAGKPIRCVYEALVDYAAEGDVLHNDDTGMGILAFKGVPPSAEDGIDPKRTGSFTTGIVSVREEHQIALFYTGRHHAGENLSSLLARRGPDLDPPIQMADALSRNPVKEFEVILANCLVHCRRNFVNVAENFPVECERVLLDLKSVYAVDADAQERGLSPEKRLELHQQESQPVLEELRDWLNALVENKEVEPNSGLGKAIAYLNKHWEKLTVFLRVPGAPLDNNLCERALKKVVLHRKNAYFFKTPNGARVGDLFLSLIHTAELAGVDPFHYLAALLHHRQRLAENPAAWLPWCYRTAIDELDPA